MFASQESDLELKYDPTLVHGTFVHSISLGLQNENIKTKMKPYLEKKIMSDEELFKKLNVCFSYEMERSQKFGSQLTPKVNAVQERGDTQAKKNTEVEQALMKELRELKAEEAAVKERVLAPPQVRPPRPQHTHQPMRQPHCAGPANKVEMDSFVTIVSGVGLVAIMCASVLPSLADAFQQNFRETIRGHTHGTGCDRVRKSVPLHSV